MYQYTREGLGECDVTKQSSTLGPGIDPRINPMNPQNGMCPLLQDSMTGRFLDYQDYVDRSRNPKNRLSRFKKFINEDCYKDYIKRFCQQAATAQPTLPQWPPRWWIEDFIRMMKGLPPKPQTPTPQTPTSLRMRANLGGWGGFGESVPLPPMTPAPPRGFDPFKAAREAAAKIVPIRPETPEERLQRILTQPVPTLPRGRSFKEWLDRRMAERRVPKWLRDSIWTSFFDKNWGLLSNLLSTAGFRGETKESIIETARAAGEVKVR